MIKMMAAACRRPGMTHAEYVAYIHRVHGAIAREQPVTLRRYVQNHVFDAAFGTRADPTHQMIVSRDSVTELYWDDLAAMKDTFMHPHTREKVGPDGANFADLRTTLSLIAEETALPVPQPGPGNAKVLHFLRKRPDLSLDDFYTRWTAAHARVLADTPVAAAALRQHVQNRQRTEGNALLAYFGGSDVPPYEGIGASWFDDETTIGLFRHYEAALLRLNADPALSFYVPEASFFLYAKEVQIL